MAGVAIGLGVLVYTGLCVASLAVAKCDNYATIPRAEAGEGDTCCDEQAMCARVTEFDCYQGPLVITKAIRRFDCEGQPTAKRTVSPLWLSWLGFLPGLLIALLIVYGWWKMFRCFAT